MRAQSATAGGPPRHADGVELRARSRSSCEPRSIDDEAGSFGRCRLSEPVATALGSASVCVGVVERFQREPAGDWDAEEAVVSLVDDVNADVVRTRVP